jgi:hypothetical protein
MSAFAIPGILVVPFSLGRTLLLSAAAYSVGGVGNYLYHYSESEGQSKHFADFLLRTQLWLNIFEGFLIYAAIGVLVGYVISSIARRLMSGSSDRGPRLR